MRNPRTMKMIRASSKVPTLPTCLQSLFNCLGLKGLIGLAISLVVVGFGAGIGIGCSQQRPRFCPFQEEQNYVPDGTLAQ